MLSSLMFLGSSWTLVPKFTQLDVYYSAGELTITLLYCEQYNDVDVESGRCPTITIILHHKFKPIHVQVLAQWHVVVAMAIL